MGIGFISKEPTVWCGNEECGGWEQITSKTQSYAIKVAKTKGWKNTKLFGWICPKCATKEESLRRN